MSGKVKTTERGWAGHFCCSHRCLFRRNTLIEYEDIKIVVSTVGLMSVDTIDSEGEFEPIGLNRHFETVAFHSLSGDTKYHDADVERQIFFDSKWSIANEDAEIEANDMHEAVVNELSQKLSFGERFEVAG
jgi:hypothetical protein